MSLYTTKGLPPDTLACNCAGCTVVLVSAATRAALAGAGVAVVPAEVAGRVKGRPYCHGCLAEIVGPPAARLEAEFWADC